MERRLVDDRADQNGRAVLLALEVQPPKPVRPAVVEVPAHAKSIGLDHGTPPGSSGPSSSQTQSTDGGRRSDRPEGADGGAIRGCSWRRWESRRGGPPVRTWEASLPLQEIQRVCLR